MRWKRDTVRRKGSKSFTLGKISTGELPDGGKVVSDVGFSFRIPRRNAGICRISIRAGRSCVQEARTEWQDYGASHPTDDE